MKRSGIICLLMLALTIPVAVQAEVGASIPGGGSGSGLNNLYILSHITEDPHPILDSWQRFNPDSPTRVVLNPDGTVNGDGEPSILMTLTPRIPLVAWARNSAQGYDVVLSRFQNGAWSTPEVLAGTLEDEMDPSLVLDPDTGEVHLFYWIDGATPKVMHRQTDPTLTSWSAEVQVSAASIASCRPAGAYHDGVLHVVYELHDYGYNQTPRQVVLAQWDGAAWIPEVVAISTIDDRLEPRVHSHNGTLWIGWIDAAGDAAWTRRSPSSGWEPLQYEPFYGLEEREFHVRGAIRAQAIQ